MADLPNEPQDDSPRQDEHIATRDIALYGSIGGFAKETIVIVNTIETATEADGPPLWSDLGMGILVLPLNMMLGAISAVVGIFLLTDVFKAPENRQKMLALAIVLGLSFPAVFDTAADNLKLQAENQELEVENDEAVDTLEDMHRNIEAIEDTFQNDGDLDEADAQIHLDNLQESIIDAIDDIEDEDDAPLSTSPATEE